MKATNSFYIKERHNPQTGTYYVKCWRMTKKEAKAASRSLYGINLMLEYKTEKDYERAIEDLIKLGHTVQ